MKHKLIYREQTFYEPFEDSTCIEIQVISEVTDEYEFYNTIKNLYLESAEVSDIEVDKSDFDDEGVIGNYFEILYFKKINNGEHSIYGIRINHPSLGGYDWDSVGIFFDTFLDVLKGEVDVVWKFQDDFLRFEYPKIYREIYDLENKLREIISFIFANKYYPLSNQKLIGEHNINPALKGKEWDEIEEDMENIFYYLTFEDYSKLDGSAIKDPTSVMMRDFLEKSHDFEEFKELLLNRGITDVVHKDFLLSIKENLVEIGMIRNVIMHGRNISEDSYTNYTIAKEKIQSKINEFEDYIRNLN